jgi:hypothetical protein
MYCCMTEIRFARGLHGTAILLRFGVCTADRSGISCARSYALHDCATFAFEACSEGLHCQQQTRSQPLPERDSWTWNPPRWLWPVRNSRYANIHNGITRNDAAKETHGKGISCAVSNDGNGSSSCALSLYAEAVPFYKLYRVRAQIQRRYHQRCCSGGRDGGTQITGECRWEIPADAVTPAMQEKGSCIPPPGSSPPCPPVDCPTTHQQRLQSPPETLTGILHAYAHRRRVPRTKRSTCSQFLVI